MVRKAPNPHDWRAWRRFRAWELTRQGWCERAVEEALDVWIRSLNKGTSCALREGPDALLARPRPVSPPQLAAYQKRSIPDFFWHGPEACGFDRDYWTCKCVASMIQEESGVAFQREYR